MSDEQNAVESGLESKTRGQLPDEAHPLVLTEDEQQLVADRLEYASRRRADAETAETVQGLAGLIRTAERVVIE